MFDSTQATKSTGGYDRILFIGLMATLCLAFIFSTAMAQTTPKPADNTEGYWNGYNISTTTEFGWRWRRVSGNDNKYRSDLNYKQGFRVFDSNFYMQSDSGKGKYFDALLISNSGWGSDPTGYTRVNMEKIGIYKFNATVRRIQYFNNLTNFANPTNLTVSEHSRDTARTLGDFDIMFLPQNDKFRVSFGASFDNSTGPGVYTTRAYSDEFPATTFTRQRADDFRFGVDGMLLGFNLGITQGIRIYRDRSDQSITSLSQGNNPPPNTAALTLFSKTTPTDGHAYYTSFNAHRTIAKKLDFTARVIYSSTYTKSSQIERYIGRDNNNNIIDLDRVSINANGKRPQTRADLGLTYNVTDNFRISNTFSFDQFTVNGGEGLFEQLDRRNPTTLVPATVITNSSGYRITRFRRYSNTLEGDYQINNSIALHIGWRYTHRAISDGLIDQSCSSTLPAGCTNNVTSEPFGVAETNGTNTLIAGMKIKPVKNWVIFWDIERGQADNVFTRPENYKFTNFRVRSRLTVKKFAFNLSAISKDNTNPSASVTIPVPIDYVTNIKSRVYSGSLDWDPISQVSFSTGYTYRHLTSYTPVVIPVSGAPGGYLFGFSQFFSRDHYAYFDVSAKPVKRVSLYASYRISLDKGQGDRISNAIQNIITSYPMQFVTPEFRVAFRITRNIDWNVGYQYYNFHDSQTPFQNYRANLPFTSLRIYFGNGSADR